MEGEHVKDIWDQLIEGELEMVKILCSDKMVLYGPKKILIKKSAYFSGLFTSGMKESRVGEIITNKISSAVKIVLRYILTDIPDPIYNMYIMFEALDLARMWQIQSFIDDYLNISKLSDKKLNYLIDLLQYCHSNKFEEFKEKVIELIYQRLNCGEIYDEDDHTALISIDSDIANDILVKIYLNNSILMKENSRPGKSIKIAAKQTSSGASGSEAKMVKNPQNPFSIIRRSKPNDV